MQSPNRKPLSMKAVVCSCLVLSFTSCGTIMHGTTQDIGISSSPSSASVTIDNTTHGQTPLVAKLERDRNHTITIELPGYQPFSATVTKSVSGWVWGNILFGGIIGLAVDAISGGLYVLTPEQVQATLVAQGQPKDKRAAVMSDSIFLQVTLAPQPGWTKIGTLKPRGA